MQLSRNIWKSAVLKMSAVSLPISRTILKDVTPEQRETIDKMIERLEEFDDVQTVYTNMKPEEGGE